MTTTCQKYYTKNILPTYICAIHKACTQGNGLEPWMLQEDNDPSHGNGPRSLRGLATCLKEANWIHCMRHPLSHQNPLSSGFIIVYGILWMNLRRFYKMNGLKLLWMRYKHALWICLNDVHSFYNHREVQLRVHCGK